MYVWIFQTFLYIVLNTKCVWIYPSWCHIPLLPRTETQINSRFCGDHQSQEELCILLSKFTSLERQNNQYPCFQWHETMLWESEVLVKKTKSSATWNSQPGKNRSKKGDRSSVTEPGWATGLRGTLPLVLLFFSLGTGLRYILTFCIIIVIHLILIMLSLIVVVEFSRPQNFPGPQINTCLVWWRSQSRGRVFQTRVSYQKGWVLSLLRPSTTFSQIVS